MGVANRLFTVVCHFAAATIGFFRYVIKLNEPILFKCLVTSDVTLLDEHQSRLCLFL